jgi:hypothetical protein
MLTPLPAAACFAAEGQRCLFYSSAGVLVGTLHAVQALWLWQRFRGSDWQQFVLEVCALLTRRQFTRQLETRFVPKLSSGAEPSRSRGNRTLAFVRRLARAYSRRLRLQATLTFTF